MRHPWLVTLIVWLIGQTPVMESIANQKTSLRAMLNQKKNSRRVLLLYGRDDARHLLIHQQQALNKVCDGVAERDMDVIVLLASDVSEPDRRFLVQYLKLLPAEDFVGWLIGKDGTVKQTIHQPVSARDLFKTVDAMPMRKGEMKH